MVLVLATSLFVVVPARAADEPEPVLTATAIEDTTAPEQSPSAVSARIDKLAKSKVMGKSSGTLVIDPATDQVLYDNDGSAPLTPASTMKVITAASALTNIGPNTTIPTITSIEPDTNRTYLVGGGDPLLDSRQFQTDPADPTYPDGTSMKRLVTQTAARLRGLDQTSIELFYDASLFTGPDYHPDWFERYQDQGNVGRVSALVVDDGRATRWSRAEDPARAAADRFAAMLGQQGIKVNSVKPQTAPGSAEEIGRVESVPVYQLVAEMLTRSDNDTAEALFRLSGIAAGYGGSFEGGAKASEQTLQELGVSALMANIADGSGLSPKDRLAPRTLAEVLVASVRQEGDLWGVGTALPIGAVDGTLRYRFSSEESKSGAGWVRAKTGTLISITSLAGFTTSRSGRVLVFASIANEAPAAYDASRKIDEIAAQLTECGCN